MRARQSAGNRPAGYFFSASSQTSFGAAVADVFESGNNNGGIISAVRFARPQLILRDYANTHSVSLFPLFADFGTSVGDASSPTTVTQPSTIAVMVPFYPKGGVDMHHMITGQLTPLRQKECNINANRINTVLEKAGAKYGRQIITPLTSSSTVT